MNQTTISTPEGSMAVVDEGDGPTVVFVHGTPSSSFEFRHVIASLHGRARCIAPDHLGFGRSDKSSSADYSLAAHQRRFGRMMDQLDVRDAVFVLHDFGAPVALPWMLEHADRVRGVVLANTFAWPAKGAFAWIMRWYATRLGRWMYRWANISVGMLLPWAWGTHKALTPELHAQYKAPFARRDERYATSALPGELIGPTITELESRVSELRQWPARAVWGVADPAVGPRELERWKSLLPGLQVEEIPNAGHFVAEEAPEAVERAVLQLLGAADATTSTHSTPDAEGLARLRDRAAAKAS